MAKIEKMFGAILKDQEQKSDELRDKIHAENKPVSYTHLTLPTT